MGRGERGTHWLPILPSDSGSAAQSAAVQSQTGKGDPGKTKADPISEPDSSAQWDTALDCWSMVPL